MKTLILLRGLPGSGKTTLAKTLSEFNVCADDYFTDDDGNYNFDANYLPEAHETCRIMTAKMMTEERPLITVHNTFTTEKEMQPYFDLAQRLGYMVFICVVENRHGKNSIHNVPQEVIDRMKHRFDVKL